MSSTSTGAGEVGNVASVGWVSYYWGSVPRGLREDMWGSRFALLVQEKICKVDTGHYMGSLVVML